MPRILNILLSSLALLILMPLFIPIVVILLLTGENKVLYLQSRVGYKNKKFKIIKFATMLSNSSNMGAGNLTLKNDPRVLPFGSFLRKSKINELPQILNIIKGDLSIVGPRPQMQVSFEQFSDEIQKKIYEVNKVNDNKELLVEVSEDIEIKIAPGMVADLYMTPEIPKKNITENKNPENKNGFLSKILGNKK